MRKMKRSAAFISVFLVALASLTGCGSKEDEEIKTTELMTEQTTEETTEATTETVSNEIISGDRTFVKTDGSHKEGTTTLTYGGHATVKIVAADGTVIYVDPNYKDADYSDPADIVLVTHGHDDHTPCSNLQVKDDATTITWKEAHPDPEVYETFEIGNIQIEAVPASNSNHSIKSCVGYIIFVDGLKIYHAGDTSMLDTMGELAGKEIDFALYPIDGSYNMDATEATEVANLVNAKYNIPIHEFDVGNVRKSDDFLPKSRLVLEYGDTIVISE